MNNLNETLATALDCCENGIAVLPCNSHTKAPLTVHGCLDATTDPSQIKQWWATSPHAMLGIATGKISGLFVLDVDTHGDTNGYASLSALEAESGRIDFEFPFFVQKRAPISELESLMNYRVKLSVERKAGRTLVTQTVTVPVTSLCPCSKEISRYGAHNQRSHITIAARLCGDLSLEEQIRFAEESASCELWSRLKRVDEKYVTESAYENPKFVEDLVRDVAGRVNADPRIEAYRVEAENFESIHNHSAYAQIFKGDL